MVDILQSVEISEVISESRNLKANSTVGDAEREFHRGRQRSLPIVNGRGSLVGVVSLPDLDHALAGGVAKSTKLSEICTPRDAVLIAFPDEPVGEALTRMSRRGFNMLPVVSRGNANKLVGVVRRDDILRAYDLALARRTEIEYRSERLRSEQGENASFFEFQLKPKTWAANKTLAQVAKRLPEGCVVVAIKRGDRQFIPHGDTRFEAGDKVMTYVHRQDIEALRATLG